MKRVLLGLGIAVVVLIGAGSAFVSTYKPRQRPASTENVERTPARLERGKYLVDAVLGCMDCHATRDLTRFGFPVQGAPGAGGDCQGKGEGMPGLICPSNITPDPETGVGAWTDGELLRAIREGVRRDGRALFPMMPYRSYKALSDEDARAVVAYLRTLAPVKNAVVTTQVDFPVSFFVKMAPQPLPGPVPEPNRQDRVAHGKYLVAVSGCQFCHTPVDSKKDPLPGRDFAGGHEFKGPWGVVRSSNLTPHATGMGDRDEAAFVGMFKAFALPASDIPQVRQDQNTIMPWLSRALMTEADLGAIHAYLRTVPAIDHAVEKRPPPKLPGAAPTTAREEPAEAAPTGQ